MPDPNIAGKKPEKLELEPGEYWWCACGHSQNQPWCDGSHKAHGFSPIKLVIEEKKLYSVCMCKLSDKKPLCDGTHKKL